MKSRHLFQSALLLYLIAAAAPPAQAQGAAPPSPIARGDVTGTLGWFNANKSDLSRERYNDWYNSSLYGGIGAGWYWTDNHKTEIDFGATTGGDIYTSYPVFVENQQTYTQSRFFFSTRKLTLSQQYQAYRNAWFHPHVAAGVDLTWEETREERSPVILYDSVTRVSRLISPPQNLGPDVDLIVRPFAAVGFKAYMSPRSFFRSDMRFTFRGGVDEVLWRFGFGMDF
jgi:opacity protein-like surface antigen